MVIRESIVIFVYRDMRIAIYKYLINEEAQRNETTGYSSPA